MISAHVVVLSLPGDAAPEAAAEEARSALRAARATPPDKPEAIPDAAILVVGEDVDPERLAAIALGLEGRAAALIGVADAPADARAALENARRILRDAKVLVIARQLALASAAVSVYGFTDDTDREKLAAVVALLVHEADKLQARRDGWEEPAQ
ncbi:MAG: hypothetical protein ACYDCK_02015 [Thermoplasmatota archaeon]